MTGDKTFLEDLQSALNHLNDPTFRPAATLCQRLGVPAAAHNWAEPLRQAIQRLQPPPSAPAQSRGQRLYQVLLQRYIHNETQESTAERLHITARHLRREQNDAVQALARLAPPVAWRRLVGPTAPGPDRAPAGRTRRHHRRGGDDTAGGGIAGPCAGPDRHIRADG